MHQHVRRAQAEARVSATTRRSLLGSAGAGVIAVSLGMDTASHAEAAFAQRHGAVIRLGTITAVQIGGLLDELLADFEQLTGNRVTVSTGVDSDAASPAAALYELAHAGKLDIVISHWGVDELEGSVGEGLVRWPVMFAANSNGAFITPPSDPAGVRGVTDPVEAFQLIAQRRSPFVVNDRYVTDTLWDAAGRPDKQDWYLDLGLSGQAAIREAARRGGYSTWGLRPFLAMQEQHPLDLQAWVFQDSLLQRVIASAVVNPGPGRTVNVKGALALQRYLLESATQARIRMFRHPDFDHPIVWPAGHHN